MAKTALITTTTASEADCRQFETVTGFSIDSYEPTGTYIRYLVKIGDGNWQKYTDGEWKDVSTQSLTPESVIAEGNTKDELLALDSTALAPLKGNKVNFAVAMQIASGEVSPTINNIEIIGQTGNKQTHYSQFSDVINLSDSGTEVEIIDIAVNKVEDRGGTVTITAATQNASGEWSEYVAYSTLVTTPATVAKAIRFRADFDVTNPGTSVATLNGVTIRHRTDNIATFSEGTGVLITQPVSFVNVASRAHAMIKHPIVKDTEFKMYICLREAPIEVKNEVLGVGDDKQHTVTLKHRENLASHGFVLYFDDTIQLPSTYSYSTADGQVTFNAPAGVQVLCDYIYNWSTEKFIEMEQDCVYPDPDDNNIVDDQFDYIAVNDDDPKGSIGVLKVAINQLKGKVTKEVLGIGTGELQAFELAHHAKPETLKVTGASNENWKYRENTDTLLITANAGTEISVAYEWAAKTNYLNALGCIFNS